MPARAMLRAAGIPVVEIMDTDGEPVDCRRSASRTAGPGGCMAEAILERGYRRFGFIGTKMPLDHRAQEALRGVHRRRLRRAGRRGRRPRVLLWRVGAGQGAGDDGRHARPLPRPRLPLLLQRHDRRRRPALECLGARHRRARDGWGWRASTGCDLLDGLPLKLATMDACRREIGLEAARLIAEAAADPSAHAGRVIEMEPRIQPGDTLRPPPEA